MWFLLGVTYFVSVANGRINPQHIVLIIADDLGWNDVGYHGGDMATPNIDALGYHGLILNRHYSQPSCTPSRAALMTARYPIRSGLQGRPLPAGFALGLPLTEKIFPEYMSELGYRTHLVGKWHLGYETTKHLPTRRGFESFFGYLNGYIGYYDGVHFENNFQGVPGLDLRRGEKGAWKEGYGRYLTELLTEEAVSVIEKHPSEQGLFLVLSQAAPHTGSLSPAREAPPLAYNVTGRALLKEVMKALDWSVGEVFSALERKGVLNNSLVIFISDNGAPTTDPTFGYNNDGSNWPLRGEKMSSHEGGVRTAAVVWSSTLGLQPRVTNQLFHITDWLPTLYSAAGGNPSDLRGIDGIDQWKSLLFSEPGPRNEFLVDMNELTGAEAIIKGSWKLVRNNPLNDSYSFSDNYYGESGRDTKYNLNDVAASRIGKLLGPPHISYDKLRSEASVEEQCFPLPTSDCHTKYCLYDIFNDPTECTDLAADYPEIVGELKAHLDVYRMQLVKKKNCTFDPRSDPIHWNDYWSPWLDSGTSRHTTTFLVGYFALMFFLIVGIL